MTADQRLIAEYRSDTNPLMMAAAKNHAFVADLHGQGKADEGFAIERRAELQEAEAVRMRERAAELEASLQVRLAIAGVPA